MSDMVDNTTEKDEMTPFTPTSVAAPKPNVPNYNALQSQLAEANLLIDDIVLKNYLSKLTELVIIPLDDELKNIGDIRLFKINEMVYQKDEYSTYKFASVFNSVQNLDCSVFIIADSDGQKTDFYMGVRKHDDKRTTTSLSNTLRNALSGQFPGVKVIELIDSRPQNGSIPNDFYKQFSAEEVLSNIQSKNITSVSCVAKNKDEEFTDNVRFIQGLDKLALAMQGQKYTAIVLAKSTPTEQLLETRQVYEMIYTQLSPFANMQLSYGTNTALSISDAFSVGSSRGTSHTTNTSTQKGTSYSKSITTNESKTKPGVGSSILKGLVGVASIVAAPFTGGASLLAGGVAMGAIPSGSKTTGKSESENFAENSSETYGESDSTNEGTNESATNTRGLTSGMNESMQLTMQNKNLLNKLERIDLQLKRIDECESIGMWECAAYFLSDTQETAEMVAGTYKALMKGDKSGVETSAINFWGQKKADQLPILREYITNFIHPVFNYSSTTSSIPVTASSLISGNELAIHMGLPRKSVCGFPVIEHANFGKEVNKYEREDKADLILGKVFNMGSETETEVRLDCDSLTMHTFITGSTGSGKSNTVYEILNQLRNVYRIPFLVVEPAKGEYKNVFGQFPDVSVYGTNPKKTNLLKLNPFSFPADIHVLEHLDRLVELFNVCWPMYAAMPAILKKAMEKAYEDVGWNLDVSDNANGIDKFPNFADLLNQLKTVINDLDYSAEFKGNYKGALCTRVESLTNGLNGRIFTSDDLSNADLFDKNVIVDLSRVGSTETKSLIMGLLVMKLNEYRSATFKEPNRPLFHITVLEEAHNLLKRTSTEQSSESSNLLGKSVELLANSIAEMRTYGEGFIIADQSPGLLDMSVIRNTNTKIILRLPEQSDRELVGFSASLNEEQIEELSKLERGVAAVYQNDWLEPALVKVSKCPIEEKVYGISALSAFTDVSNIKKQIISFLIKGRVKEQLEFDIDDIKQNIEALNLSTRNREFLDEQIAEFLEEGSLSVWDDDKFKKLSRYISDILGIRSRAEACVLIANDYAELSDKLAIIVRQTISNVSNEVAITLSQCLMKDLSVGRDETKIRERLYMQWVDFIKEGGTR